MKKIGLSRIAFRLMMVVGMIAGVCMTSCKDDDSEPEVEEEFVQMDAAELHSYVMNEVFLIDSGSVITYTPRYGKRLRGVSEEYTVGVETEAEARAIFNEFIPAVDSAHVREASDGATYEFGGVKIVYKVGSGEELAHISFSSEEVKSYELSFVMPQQWPDNDVSVFQVSGLYRRRGRYFVCVSEWNCGKPAVLATFDMRPYDYEFGGPIYTIPIGNKPQVVYWRTTGNVGALTFRVANDKCFDDLTKLMNNELLLGGLAEEWSQLEGTGSPTYRNIVGKDYLNKWWPTQKGPYMNWFPGSFWVHSGWRIELTLRKANGESTLAGGLDFTRYVNVVAPDLCARFREFLIMMEVPTYVSNLQSVGIEELY